MRVHAWGERWGAQKGTHAPNRQAPSPKKDDVPLRPRSFSHSSITLLILPPLGGGANRGWTHSPAWGLLKPSGLAIKFNRAFLVKRNNEAIFRILALYLHAACPHANHQS